MATLNSYDNTADAGAASLNASSIAGSPSSYKVYDITGAVIANGSVSGSTTSLTAVAGSWPAGWGLCVFESTTWDGGTGYIADAVQISAFRSGVAPLPPIPAAGTAPNAADPTSRNYDVYMHSFTAMGPQRWQIHDAANPNGSIVSPDEEQGGNISYIQQNIALERGAAGYLNPTYADAARPHDEFVQFPNNQYTESGYAAGVTAAVQALGPSTSYGVKYFEGLNEPQEQGLSPTQSAVQYNNFRAAVKAGDPNAFALGPGEVSYAPAVGLPIGDLATWLANITPGTLDAFSIHDYNAYNGDFLATDGWLGALWTNLENAGYPQGSIPFFFTETGNIVTIYGVFDPRRIVQWLSVLYLTGERWGMPKEHIYYFYDTNVGFSGNPSWIKENTSDLRPHAVFYRVYSEEVYGLTYSTALDFGTLGNNFYRGNVYRGSRGTCVAIIAQGNPSDTVTLAISDMGSVTYVDWQGQTQTAAVANGQVTIPICDLPTYIRLSASCSVNVVDVGAGVIAGSPTNLAPAATVVSGSGAANTGLVNDGVFQTGGYLSGSDSVFTSNAIPDYLELDWPSAVTIQKVLIRQVAPWTNFDFACAMVQGKLEYWNGSGWLPCPTVSTAANHWDDLGHYDNQTASSFLGQVGGNPYRITFYDNNWCHNVDFSYPITTTKLRWTVTQTSYGHIPDKETALYQAPGIANGNQSLKCSELVVLSAPTPSGVLYGPFAA